MKKIIPVLALLCLTAFGQASDSLRIVDGKACDTKGTNWIEFKAVCSEVFPSGVGILTEEKPSSEPKQPHLPWNTYIVIHNYPTNPPVKIGSKLSGKIMKTGSTKLGGGFTVEIWDFGIPCKTN